MSRSSSPEPNDALLDQALSWMPAPPLAAAVADRVGRLAAATLAPPEEMRHDWRARIGGTLVPALLMSAAAIRATDTLSIAKKVFATSERPSDPPRGSTKP